VPERKSAILMKGIFRFNLPLADLIAISQSLAMLRKQAYALSFQATFHPLQ
jgi:hypothetical protein